MAVLSHNVTVAAFILAFCAACPLFLIGRVPGRVVMRSGVAAGHQPGALLFLPAAAREWLAQHRESHARARVVHGACRHSSARAGIAGGLGGPGSRRVSSATMIWWALMLAGTFCLLLVTHMTLESAVFPLLLPAVWVLAAHAMEVIARKLGLGVRGAAWYACVAAAAGGPISPATSRTARATIIARRQPSSRRTPNREADSQR